MKTSFKTKLIVTAIITIILFNFCSPVFAFLDMGSIMDAIGDISFSGMTEDQYNSVAAQQTGTTATTEDQIVAEATAGAELSWIGGILYYPIHLMVGVATALLEYVAEGITDKKPVTVGDILFNDVEIVNIDFFNPGSSSSVVQAFKTSVAKWYYVMRTIAIIASLCVLLYVAIRMAISTVADDKAKYKSMFKDWVVGFCILFVLHYIMLLIIKGNNLFVDVIKNAYISSNGAVITYIQELKGIRYSIVEPLAPQYTVAEKFGSGIALLMLAIYTIMFLWQYIKRLFLIGFLMMIAPLITITYAIDKVGDGKAQALNNWMKEFFWTVLLQPFQCVIYITIVSTGFEALAGSKSFTSAIFLIFCLHFLLKAEGIIKQIFGISAKHVGSIGDAAGEVAKVALLSRVLRPGNADKRSKPKTPSGSAPKLADKTSKTPELVPEGKGVQAQSGTVGAAHSATREAQLTGDSGSVGNASSHREVSHAGTVDPTVSVNRESVGSGTSGGSASSQPVKPKGKFDSFMDKYLSNGIRGTAADWAGKKGFRVAGKVINGYAKIGGAIIGGASALTTPKGDFLSKAYGGYAIGDKLSSVPGNWLENKRTENREREFDSAYDNFLKENEGIDLKTVENKLNELAKVDLNGNEASKLTEAEKRLAETVQRLATQYENTNSKNAYREIANRVNTMHKNMK